MRPKTILVPIDYSAHSLNALKIAISIASKLDSTLILMHSHDVSSSTSLSHYRVMLDTMKKPIRKTLLKELKGVTKNFTELNNVFHDWKVTFGPAADDIKEMVKTENVDLIVMGTKGRSNSIKQRLGSISSQIAVAGICPVLVVPKECEHFNPSKMMLATSYCLINELAGLPVLREFALAYNAELTILNIEEKPDSLGDKEIDEALEIHKHLEKTDHKFDQIVSAHVNSSLLTYVEMNSIDLVAIQPSKHNFFERIFHISHTEQITMEANVPILALHD